MPEFAPRATIYSFLQIIKPVRSIYFWLITWGLLFYIYLACIYSGTHLNIANNIAYYTQVFFDFSVGLSCFVAYKLATEKNVKNFLKLTFISIIIGLYSDEMYNFIFHFIKIEHNNPILNLIWIVPYTTFLVMQIMAWSRLIKSSEKKSISIRDTWLTTLCFVQAPIIIFISIIIANFFKNTPMSIYGAVQISNTVLEIALFFIVAISLARSKQKWLSCFATGILLLVVFNMAHRFSYMGGDFNKIFDMAWLIAFIFIIFGFIYFTTDRKKVATFYDKKSLFVLTSAILMLITSILFFVFFFLEIFMSNVIKSDSFVYLTHLFIHVPGILICLYMTAVFLGQFVSAYVLRSMNNISDRIDLIQQGASSVDSVKHQNHTASEVQKLDNFITHTVKALYDANQIKSEFLMSMSHDFRTPVSGIVSMSQLIYEKISDEKIKSLQKLVVDSSNQLMEIIDQILGYYQLLYNQNALACEKIDLIKLIDEIVLFLSAKVKEKNLSVILEHKNPELYCAGSRTALHRILLNVISNAIKFTEQGYVKIVTHASGDTVVIKIEDTGIGIDQSHLNAIFEPFYKIESPYTSKYSGIGLGLSHVKILIEKLNGKINVVSTLNKGTAFELIFPAS